MKQTDAKKLGWKFSDDGNGTYIASKNDVELIRSSDAGALLANIAEQEGQPFAVGYGLAGEDPEPVPSVEERIASSLEPLLDKETVSGSDLRTVIQALRS